MTVAGIAASVPLSHQPDATPTSVAAISAHAPATTSIDVRAFAGALPVQAPAAPSPEVVAAAAAKARTDDALRASRDLKRRHLTALRAIAHTKAVAAHTKAVAAHKKAVAAHKKAVAAAKHRAAQLARRSKGEIAVEWARKMMGRPYRWGATGPSSFDCSGLTAYAWRHAGISLSHSSAAQRWEGRHIVRADLRAGDLVFFGRWGIHHVGIYIGNGLMISAPHTGDHVRIQSMDRSDYVGAVRPG